MSAVTLRRPTESLLADAQDAADRLVHEFAQRASMGSTDPRAYWLAGAAVSAALGLEPASWIRSARAAGASWQTVADAMGLTKGNVHGQYRYLDHLEN